MRARPKLDANHTAIVKALRQMGASVQSLASIGHGCPDLLVGWSNKAYVVEIKDGTLPPSKRQLTEDEREWMECWTGPFVILSSVENAIAWLAKLA
jgi:hypothetical protein